MRWKQERTGSGCILSWKHSGTMHHPLRQASYRTSVSSLQVTAGLAGYRRTGWQHEAYCCTDWMHARGFQNPIPGEQGTTLVRQQTMRYTKQRQLKLRSLTGSGNVRERYGWVTNKFSSLYHPRTSSLRLTCRPFRKVPSTSRTDLATCVLVLCQL